MTQPLQLTTTQEPAPARCCPAVSLTPRSPDPGSDWIPPPQALCLSLRRSSWRTSYLSAGRCGVRDSTPPASRPQSAAATPAPQTRSRRTGRPHLYIAITWRLHGGYSWSPSTCCTPSAGPHPPYVWRSRGGHMAITSNLCGDSWSHSTCCTANAGPQPPYAWRLHGGDMAVT